MDRESILFKIVVIFIICLAPALFFIVYFYYKDKYEKEPLSFILFSFALGTVSAPFSLILYDILEKIDVYRNISYIYEMPRLEKFLFSMFAIAPIEELSKFIPLFFFIKKTKILNEKIDSIVYSSVASLGFAMVENFYFMLNTFSIDIARAITLPFNHVLFSSFWGYTLFFESSKKSYKIITGGLILSVIYHGIYDFILFDNAIPNLFTLPLILILWWFLSKIINKSLEESPFKPGPVQPKKGR